MNAPKLHIKNMVCPRCIKAVENSLQQLDIPYRKIQLGEVDLVEEISPAQKRNLRNKLNSLGFELLESAKSALISKIKSLLIEQIHHQKEPLEVKYSEYITHYIPHDYSYLSRLFSAVEGITIERYIHHQKIEKAKELLFYDELSLGQIAYQLNYSSTAHLSASFKKETGLSPTEFKKQHKPGHRSIDI